VANPSQELILRSRRFIRAGCAAEFLLILLAWLLAWGFGVRWLADLHWNFLHLLLGLAATLPLLGGAALTLRSRWRPLARIREFLESALLPLLRGTSLAQLALLSIMAGFAEELLFRGVLHPILERSLGLTGAVVISNLIFGLCHFVTPGYAVFAALVGIYLSLAWIWSGNLLVPIVAHASYDFAVLWYLVHTQRAGARD
jgi:uncharacterized protein